MFGGALEIYKMKYRSKFAAHLEHFYYNHESQKGRPLCKRANLSSALMFFDTKLFAHFKGFKDIPRIQDTELTERVASQGYDLYFCPDVLGYQIQDSTFKDIIRKVFISGSNLYVVRYKPNTSFCKRIFFFLLLPLMSLFKISRIIIRHLKFGSWQDKIKTIILSPGLYLCGLVWMLGVYRALLTNAALHKTR